VKVIETVVAEAERGMAERGFEVPKARRRSSARKR
jgi:hypothetical protein